MKYIGIVVLGVGMVIGLALSAPLFIADAQASGLGQVQVVESNAKHAVLEVSAPSLTKTDRVVNGAFYTELTAESWSLMDERGKPQLPVYGTLLAVPQGAKITVRVLRDKTRIEKLAHPVIPVATPRVSMKVEDTLPTFEGNDVIPDAATYASAALYPNDIYTTTAPANWRSQRYIRVQLRPFQFNPATRELTIHEKLRVEIDFGVSANAPEAQLGAQVAEGGFEQVFKNSFLNYEVGRKWRSPAQITPRSSRVEAAASTADSFKLNVTADGMYKVTCSELQSQGLDWGSFTWNNAKLSFLGNEVAIQVSDGDVDNHCDNGEFFVFFGQAPSDYAIPYNVYWLTDTGGAGKRMIIVNTTGTNTPTSYVRTAHWEENGGYITYAPFSDGADHWVARFVNYPFPAYPGDDVDSVDITFDLSDLAPGATTGAARALVQSGTQLPNTNADLSSVLTLNAGDTHTQAWKFGASLLHSMSVSNLVAGTNTLRIGDVPFIGSGYSVFLNYAEIDYPATFTAANNVLRFKYSSTGSWQYQVSNFTQNNLVAYEIGDPTNVKKLGVNVSGSNPYTAAFGDNVNSAREYMVLDTSQYKTVASVTKDTPSTLRSGSNGADYIIITYGAWKSNLAPLAAQRATLGRVNMVDVEDVYDEFNYGIKSAEAIRNFLEYAYANWQQPKPAYVLLVGNGNYDNGGNEPTYIPVMMKFVDPWIGMTSSDHALVTLDENSLLPSMAIGRLPALTAADVDGMVEKLVGYNSQSETGAWRKRVLFATDNYYSPSGAYDPAGDFYSFSEEVAGDSYFFPSPMIADRVYFNPCTDIASYPYCDISSIVTTQYSDSDAAATAIRTAISDGRLIVNYAGHGAITSWADALLGSSDAGSLTRPSGDYKYPFMLPMTCYDGYFHSGESVSIAEALVRQAGGGAIGSFAPTGLGVATGHDYLDRGFFEALMQNGKTLVGDATIAAKIKLFAEGGTSSLDLISTFNLIGDPGTLMLTPLSPTCAGKPMAPPLFAPANGAKPKKTILTLQWNPVSCVTKYKVVIRMDSKKGPGFQKGSTQTTSFQTKTLTPGRTYYWKVQACNSFGCAKSAWFSFTVK